MIETTNVAGAEHAYAHHEHEELLAGLIEIGTAAEVVGRAEHGNALASIRRVRKWIASVVIPHLKWENVVIFPEIDAICGTTWATKLMRFDHLQITRAMNELDRDVATLADRAPTHQERWNAQTHLVVLETLLRAHIEREEIVLPVLDARR